MAKESMSNVNVKQQTILEEPTNVNANPKILKLEANQAEAT